MSLSLLPLTVPVLRRLASGDLVGAGRLIELPVPPFVLDLQWVWATFADRMGADPARSMWYARNFAVEDGRIVANIGPVGPPDDHGVVFIGYTVAPIDRGRGVATAAARLLLKDVIRRPGVRTIAARVNPDNAASLRVCAKLGLIDVGEQANPVTRQMMRRLELRVAD